MTEAKILLLANKSSPPGLENLQSKYTVTLSDENNLPQQLCEHNIVYIWDFFWDRQTTILQDLWPRDSAVEWLHLSNVGIDKIVPLKEQYNIPYVTNVRGIYDRPIAEYVLGSYFYVQKQFFQLARNKTDKAWIRQELGLVSGSRAVVIGAGSIGKEIRSLLKSVGISVEIVGRTTRMEPDGYVTYGVDKLTELIRNVDLVVLAAPLNEETRGIIGSAELKLMGPESVLINIGRGELVKDQDLQNSLRENEIKGAVLDVFAVEPLPKDSPYWELDNCLVTAHLSGVVHGWKEKLARVFEENLERFVAGKDLENII